MTERRPIPPRAVHRRAGCSPAIAPARLAVAVVLAAATACNEPFSNEDIRFLKALPSADQVELDVPGARTSTAGLSPAQADAETPADYYLSARQTSNELDGITGFVLRLVEAVQSYPPTARDDVAMERVWGPFPGDQGVEHLMTIRRVETATIVRSTSTSTAAEVDAYFTYALVARRAGTDDDWIPYFAGISAQTEDLETGMGAIYLAFESVHALTGKPEPRGLAFVGYDNRFGQRTVELGYDRDVDPAHPFARPEAAYRYEEATSGLKTFIFAFRQNIPELVPDTGDETFIIAARWLPDRRGRADAFATEGDLAGRELFATECWDGNFVRTFLFGNVPGLQLFGRLEACAPPLQRPIGR